MAVKASRYLTHLRRLREAAEPVKRLVDAAVLASWAERIAGTWEADRDVYVYFNNDQGGAAPRGAAGFAAALARLGRDIPRAWPASGPGG
jgi:uncharacterized protein YecE (DUF72 family)